MKPLLAILQEERECLGELIEAMTAERDAIASARFHDMPPLLKRKEEALSRVAQMDADRELAQSEAGPIDPGTGCASGEHKAVLDAWCAVLDRAAQAAEINRELAAIVCAHRGFTSEALSAMQAGSQPLYGRDGSRSWRPAHLRLVAG